MRALLAGGGLLCVQAACSSMDSSEAGFDATAATGTTSGAGPTSGAGGGGLPPEEELESSYRAPVATGRYVWITNPESGRVAFIDATTLSIELVDAGHAPTYLAAVPDPEDDVAIVLNVLSFDATLLRAGAGGELSTDSLAVPSGGNRWAISADGRWATAWTDAREVENADPLDGYQDITVLDLHNRVATPLAVGYRPVEVGYDVVASRLFAVTQDGVSVIALDAPEPKAIGLVALSDDPLEDAATRDVAITPDGSYAIVRREGDAVVRVIALDDGERTDVALPGPVTDLDLSADGSVAVAVVRETSQVGLLRLPDIAGDPSALSLFSVDGVTVGSVALAESSSVGFLYTNAVPSEVLTSFDSASLTGEPQNILLHAPILAVFPTQDAAHAIVVHDGTGEASTYAGAVSLVPVTTGLPSKIVGLDHALQSIAIAPLGHRAIIATGVPPDGAFSMIIAELPSLQTIEHPLASRPIASGIVAQANRGFVAQEHPDGRISFVDFDDGEVRTLTGFELAAQVVNGSEP